LNRAAYLLYGKKNACDEVSLAGRTDGWNFRSVFEKCVGRRPSVEEAELLHREYIRHLPYYVKKALREKTYVLPPGIRALLKRLSREPGVLLGLGTGNMEKGARIKLEPSGLNEYFAFGGYGSDAFDRAALLRHGVKQAEKVSGENISPRDVYIVGDTPLDVAAGKRAGFNTIAVATGFAEWRDLAHSRPDHLALDFRGIDQWLKWLKIK
jgi:phosphoglycolate phosphatase-like HAD superfamily hydrolase